MQYKLNTAIRVEYLASDNITGISDLYLTPTNPSGTDKTPILFTEIGDGLYKASFTPDALGWWSVRVSSLTYPENAYVKVYYIGDTDNPNPMQGAIVKDWYPRNVEALDIDSDQRLRLDPAGNLKTRAAILTDEGSVYDPFAGSSLGEDWESSIGSGASISVANSLCTIASGTTINAETQIDRLIDYPPLVLIGILNLSQRIANQDFYFGFADAELSASDTMFARFHFYGTDNTKISVESQSSVDTNGNQGINTQLLLPMGFTTAQYLHYKIECDTRSVRYYVGSDLENMILLANHSIEIPNPYTEMYMRCRCKNSSSAPATSTTFNINTIYIKNMNVCDFIGEVTGKVSINQNIIPSIVNSSSANLASSATFTGAAETSLGGAGIQVNLKTDQPTTVKVQQSMDGVNWDIEDIWYLEASIGDSRTFQATASYFRILVTNNGASTTTYLRLQAVLCPIVEALPRKLSSTGDLKVDASDRTIAELNKFFFINSEYSSGSSETDSFLIKNPSTSTKNLYLKSILISGMNTVAVRCRVRIYQAPTISDNGTVQTIYNRNIGSGLRSSIALAYHTPTISNRGTRIFAYSVQECNTVQDDFNLGQIIYPNQSILITIHNDATNKITSITFVWAELP